MDDVENLPFYVLASVIMAVLIGGVLALHFRAQLGAGVDQQAQALVDEISRTCFAALARQQPTYALPKDVGGSSYELRVEDNTIIVTIIEGARAGRSYYSSVNAELVVEDNGFRPGGKVHVQGRGDRVVISASPIAPPPWEIERPETRAQPPFYTWANENVEGRQMDAVAVAAAYFYSLERHPARKENKVLDVLAYRREGDVITSRVGYRGAEGDEFLACVRATKRHDVSRVGEVTGAWVIENVEGVPGDIADAVDCPSVENAARTGWLYSPSQVLAHLRGRTWRLKDNTIVVVPAGVSWTAAAAGVGRRTFCTYRFSFTHGEIHVVLFFGMLATAPGEPLPGFTFTSEPPLEPVT